MKVKGTICSLVAAMLMLNFTTVYADNTNTLKKKQKDVNSQMESKKGEINQLRNKTNNVAKEIQALDKEVEEASIDLEKVENQLVRIQESIEKNTKELEEAEKALKEKEEVFNQRVRAMYMNGDVGYLELLLSSKDIKDFFSRKEAAQAIAEYDKDLIIFMKEQKDIIEKKRIELKAQRASVETTKSKIKSRKADLEVASRKKADYMSRLQSDLTAYEQEYDKLNNYAKEIESKIQQLQVVNTPYLGGSTSPSSGGASFGGSMSWPVPGHNRISSYYGYRIHPIFKTQKLHTGIDIPAPTGTSINAAANGTVIHAGGLGGYGNTIMIDHGGGIVTLYAHNSSLTVSNGQSVSQGQTIARAGSTGNSTGPHCHFEVRRNGAYIDPIPWLKGN